MHYLATVHSGRPACECIRSSRAVEAPVVESDLDSAHSGKAGRKAIAGVLQPYREDYSNTSLGHKTEMESGTMPKQAPNRPARHASSSLLHEHEHHLGAMYHDSLSLYMYARRSATTGWGEQPGYRLHSRCMV